MNPVDAFYVLAGHRRRDTNTGSKTGKLAVKCGKKVVPEEIKVKRPVIIRGCQEQVYEAFLIFAFNT